MRLHAVHEGKAYATVGRDLFVDDGGGGFDRISRLPLPTERREALVHRALTSRGLRSVTKLAVGAVTAVNVWPLTSTDILATVGRQVSVSADGGYYWERSHELPPSSGPMGVLPPAVAYRDGTTYLGEYPLADKSTPRVLASRDHGRTWSTYAALPDVRHVHAIQSDPYSDDIWVTTGDTDTESTIGRLRDGEVERVGGGSQDWRAVEIAFTPTGILWGMDCVYADVNRIFELPRDEFDAPEPTPRQVHHVSGSVYYAASFDVGGDRWIAFSTAMEAGQDSTGPDRRALADPRGLVLASSSATEYSDWYELATFRRRSSLADRLPGTLPRANGYVFLEADPELGLFVNPYNTAAADGTIQRFPSDRFVDWPRSGEERGHPEIEST